jgi:hypothetical protein
MATIKGDYVEKRFTFHANGVVSDPDVVKVGLEAPDGSETTFVYGTDAEVTRISTGIYKFRKQMDGDTGSWRYTVMGEWTGATPGLKQGQGVIKVVSAYVDVVT